MPDNQKKISNVQEQLFEAIEILTKKQIESVRFDETINATVADASKAESGEYVVSTGNAKFTAYSTETRYKENDAVLVTIPQGNYDNQKMIIGKQVNKSENTPIPFQSPFEQIIDVTNNLIPGKRSQDYWANGEDYRWEEGEVFQDFEDCIWNSGEVYYQNFTVIGLQVQVSTWLGEYNTIKGNYGLIAKITFQDIETGQTFWNYFNFDSDEFFGDPYNFETYYTQEQIFDISDYKDYPIVNIKLFAYQRNNFKTTDGEEIPAGSEDNFNTVTPNIFIKDPYLCLGKKIEDFQTDTAEIMCDSSLTYWKHFENFTPITENIIKTTEVTHSESHIIDDGHGGFIEIIDHEISETIEHTVEVYELDQEQHYALYDVSNLVISVSPQDQSTFYAYNEEKKGFKVQTEQGQPEQYIKLYVKDIRSESARISSNKKNIQLRWIHKDTESNIIRSVVDDAFPENYKVYWYRYKLGAHSPDDFAGAHWERFYGIKAEMDQSSGDWALQESDFDNGAEDQATNYLYIEFQPNINRQTERIKAIVLKDESDSVTRVVAVSNILEFTNDDEVRSQATIIDMNELAILFEDEQQGQYFVYNRAGKANGQLSSEYRTLTAVFDPDEYDVSKKARLTDCYSIKWTFPFENTMIVPLTNDEVPQEVSKAQAEQYFTRTGENVNDLFTVHYRIKENLDFTYSNNTVKLEITKDGATYTAFAQMSFGTAGTSGSDYTLNVEWDSSRDNSIQRAVIDLSDNGTHQLVGNIVLKDQSGQRIEIPNNAGLVVDWLVAEYGSLTSMSKEKEEKDIYYPVFTRRTNEGYPDLKDIPLNIVANLDSNTNPDYKYQSGDYYYFIDEENKGPYYTFQIDNKKFSTDSVAYTSDNFLYRKRRENEENKKNKIEFRKVSFEENVFNQETGELNTYNGNSIVIATDEVTEGKYYKKYYYNKYQRYFIKVNDIYIIDPYDDYQEGETYYEPVEEKERTYNTADNYIEISTSGNQITLTANPTLTMDSIWVLRVRLTSFGDYPLEASFPIALKKSDSGQSIKCMNGPTFVRYSCDGETDFDKTPYDLETANFSISENDKKWRIICPNDEHEIVPVDDDSILNTKDNFLPSLERDKSNPNKYLLSPPSIYVPQYRPYAVQCYTHNDNNDTDTIYWTQSILVYEDNYPSTTLNKWTGKEIVTDEDAGTITASGFSAGKKEKSDNTFTGVVIGDWSRSDMDAAVAKNTGVYGFNHGSMSYAFKDDGTGFIGKDGKGRIFLDGDKSQIFSANWVNTRAPTGMLLDIDDGYIKMQSKVGYTYTRVYQPDAVRYFVTERWKYVTPSSEELENKVYTDQSAQDEVESGSLYSSSTTYYKNDGTQWAANTKPEAFSESIQTYGIHNDQQLYIGETDNQVEETDVYDNTEAYYTRTYNANYITLGSNQTRYPLAIGTQKSVADRGFRVEWNGTTYINNGKFAGEIDAQGGKISGDLTVTSTLYGGVLRADELYVDRGKIGGWTINNNSLSGGQTTLNSSTGITTNQIEIKRQVNQTITNLGTLGLIEGSDNSGTTYNIGITSINRSILLESSDKIRLSGTNGSQANNIYILGNMVDIGLDGANTSRGDGIMLRVNSNTSPSGNSNGPNWNYYVFMVGKIATGQNQPYYYGGKPVLYTNIPAADQHGIYARFA